MTWVDEILLTVLLIVYFYALAYMLLVETIKGWPHFYMMIAYTIVALVGYVFYQKGDPEPIKVI